MNITLSVDEEVIKEARQTARSMGKSLNQLVREYLEELTARAHPARDVEELRQLSECAGGRSRGWRFNREELHDRS